MSRSNKASVRLRLSLLASSSLVASGVLVGGVALTALTPTAALASCSPGTFSGAAEVCSGVDAAIAAVVSADQAVLLVGETVTAGGITLSDAGAGYDIGVQMNDLGGLFPAGSVTSLVGDGISLTSGGGALLVTTIPNGAVSGLANGISTITSGTGTVEVNVGETVGATVGSGVNVRNGTGAVDIDVQAAITAGSRGITVESGGAVTIDVDADITAGRNAIRVGYPGAAPSSVDVTVQAGATLTGNLSASGPVINLRGQGVTLVMDGDTLSDDGIVVLATTGLADATIGGNVTATNNALEVNGISGSASFTQTGGTIASSSLTDAAVRVIGGGGGVTLTTAGAGSIVGAAGGLEVSALTGGGVSGVLDGDISTTGGDAVNVQAAGPVNLTFNGTIAGGTGAGDDGISITATTAGATIDLVTNGAVSGDPGVVLIGAGGDIDYDANNNVSGTAGAITASNTLTGDVDISVNTLGTVIDGTNAGAGAFGISATAVDGTITVSSQAGTSIIGDTFGVVGQASGTGDVDFDFAGDVTGGFNEAILATSNSGEITIDTALGSDVASTAGWTIRGLSTTGDVTVTLNGTVNDSIVGGGGGVRAATGGAGDATIIANDDVTTAGVFFDVLQAETVDGLAKVTVGAGATISGGNDDVVSATATGTGGVDVDTGLGSLLQGGNGVNASTVSGAIDIDLLGDVGTSGTPTGGSGVIAASTSGQIDIDAASIYASGDGIRATNSGANITINAGSVSATGDDGIDVTTGNGGVASVTVTGATSGGDYGILVNNNGGAAGSIVIDVDDVTGSFSDGIAANSDNGSTIAITAGDVSGQRRGIDAYSSAGGGVTVTLQGSVTGVTGDGVRARSDGGAGNVLVQAIDGTAGLIDADSSGIVVRTDGTGDLTVNLVDATADIDAGDNGIVARTGGSGAVTVFTNGDITSGDDGVFAGHAAGGANAAAVLVTTNGAIDAGGRGINVSTRAGSSSTLTIAANGSITSDDNAIEARSNGSGLVDIDAAGAIDSANGHGVFATADTGGIDIYTGVGATIDAGDDGIHAEVSGATGGIIILADGAIGNSLDFIGGTGIYATIADTTNADAISVTSTAGIFSDTYGIDILHSGTGDVTVEAAAITTNNDHGINVEIDNNLSTGEINIDANGAIDADDKGIKAVNAGLGLIDIETFSTVMSNGIGVQGRIDNGFSTAGITITTHDVITAGDEGVYAENNGLGTSTVAIGANVTGSTGVVAEAAGAVSVTSSAFADITGTTGNGIEATSSGSSSSVSLAFGSDVTATSGNGIVVSAAGGGAGSVSTGGFGDIDAGGNGIVVTVTGGGAATVTTGFSGSLDAGANGIVASGDGAGTVSVTTGAFNDMTAGNIGILASNSGTGDVVVTTGFGSDISAAVSGIEASAMGGGDATINIGAFSDIDPDQYGAYDYSALGDATVNSGTGATITIDDSIDATEDFINFGVYAESGRATDAGAGDPSVEVALGTNNSITVGPGTNADLDGGIGIYATNSNVGGDGSISVTTGNGLTIDVTSDGGAGVLATTDNGDGNIGITLGTGTITVTAIDDDDAGGLLSGVNGTGGVVALASGGSVTIDSDVNVAVVGAGPNILSAGIAGFTDGAGTVMITSGGTVSSSNGAGILAQVENNTATVVNTGAITAVNGSGIDASADGGGAGSISVTNSAALGVTGGDGIYTETATGGITIANNAGGTIAGTATNGITALVTGAGGAISVTNNASVGTGTGAAALIDNIGISTSLNSGASTTTVTNTGPIFAANRGIDVSTGATGLSLVTNSGAIRTTLAGGRGISVTAVTGPVTVNNNAGGTITATSGTGIWTSATGAGATNITSAAAISGSSVGVSATNNGGGALNVTLNSGGTVNTSDDGIRTDASTGTTTITTNANVTSSAASAIDADASSGTVIVNNDATLSGVATAGNAIVRVTKTGGSTTINNDTASAGSGTIGSSASGLAISVSGGTVAVTNRGVINGRVDYTGATSSTFTNSNADGSSTWGTSGTSTFTGGVDTITNQASGGVINVSGATWNLLAGADTISNAGTLNASGTNTFDLGADGDTFTNSGVFNVSGTTTVAAGAGTDGATNTGTISVDGTLTFTNLETFGNSSLLDLQDNGVNDLLRMDGATYTGSTANSLLTVDANLAAVSQTDCSVALTAADCLAIIGGTTAGSTLINVNDTSGVTYGAFNPDGIVLVDVAGGTSDDAHFTLDPTSDFWRADANSADGVLDKGLFFYDLTYDATAKQHLLVGLPDSEALEMATLASTIQNVWHFTTGSWFDRQADLRTSLADLEPGSIPGGLWLRIAGNWIDRDDVATYDVLGTTYSFNISHEVRTTSLIGGFDLVNVTSDNGGVVVGVTAGMVDSDIRFQSSMTRARMEGSTLGAYGSYIGPNFFVDLLLNANNMDVDWDAPTVGPDMPQSIDSFGGRLEGGYQLGWDGPVKLEPLVSLAYVTTDFSQFVAPGANIVGEEATSFRGALGLRATADGEFDTYTLKFGATGRVWEEFEGENSTIFDTAGPDLTLIDDFGGTLGDVAIDLSLFSDGGHFSAFTKVGMKFKEDFQSTDGTIGFRYTW